MQDPTLWSQIQGYEFRPEDPENAPRGGDPRSSIAARLSDDENWAPSYIETAIQEYLRFTYLSRISNDHLTPSEIIDRVWHAHMIDTRDYIDRFCQHLFGTILHHEPCSGPEEIPRYERQYATARRLYLAEFGIEPPENVWIYRTAQDIAADNRQATRARILGWGTGLGTALGCYFAFGWVLAALFCGCVVGTIVSMILAPRIPGPTYNSSSDSDSGGCSGCGD